VLSDLLFVGPWIEYGSESCSSPYLKLET